ncbi:MAG TPA: GTPase HflX, partial [Terriglobia bacterium]|nr:GTPase HflX [Terriglobia bacterium]
MGWASTRRTSPSFLLADEGETLQELRELATSAGAQVVGSAVQRSPAPDPATLVGRGKVEEIRDEARSTRAEVILFDHDLTPTQ